MDSGWMDGWIIGILFILCCLNLFNLFLFTCHSKFFFVQALEPYITFPYITLDYFDWFLTSRSQSRRGSKAA